MLALKLLKGIALSKLGRKTPLVVINKVTFRCNLQCRYCGYWKTPRHEMNTEQCKRAISEFADAGCVYWEFTGGEPTVRDDIGELIAHGKDCGLIVSVTTNGILMKKRLESLKKADLVHISFDGDKDVHEKMRGRGTYKKSINAIKLAVENGINVYPETVISKLSIEDDFKSLRKAIDFAESMGRKLTVTFPYKDTYNKEKIDAIIPSQKDMGRVVEFLEHKKREGVVKTNKSYLNWCKNYEKGKTTDCFAGKLFCEMFPDGKVAHCLFREDGAIDGLEHGFVSAFRRLEPKKCSCTVGYMQYNLLFSLNPKTMLERVHLIEKLL